MTAPQVDVAPPRVLHVITDPDRRGAQTAAVELDRQLRSRGWDSRIVALGEGSSTGGLNVAVLGTRPLSARTLTRLRARARTVGVVVAHGSTTLPACAVALAGSTPFVYANIGDPRAWLTTTSRRLRTRWALGRAERVVAISPQSRSLLVGWLGLPQDRVTAIPNSRDPDDYRPLPADVRDGIRRSLGALPGKPLVLWIGALSPEKRPDLAHAVAARLPGVTVMIVGDGPLRHQVEDSGRAVGVSTLPPRADLDRLLGAADAVLITSDTEGVPGIAIEAGLCGVPTASRDVGFVSDVVVDGMTGRLVGGADAAGLADAVLSCIEHRDEWGRQARRHCRATFSPDVTVPAWEALLQSVRPATTPST